MKYFKKNVRYLAAISVIFIISIVFLDPAVLGEKVPMDPASNLQQLGYPTDTAEQILVATKDESYFVREQALQVLTKRIGKDAIPTLKLFLDDPRVEVRYWAAHLLGTLGDKSGLEQMRKDLKEFAPSNGVPLSPDPNEDPETTRKKEARRNSDIVEALRAARVLAELGDHQGYKLSKRMALEGPLAVQRSESVFVLVEIAKTDRNTLSTEGIDPTTVLYRMAESEKNHMVFGILTNLVHKKLDHDIAVNVLEKAKDSPNQSDEHRRVARILLNRVKARKKAAESQSKDPNSCCDK